MIAMFRVFVRLAALAVLCLPALASAEPIKLRLSFFTSDRSVAYVTGIQPFVEAINREGNGLVEVEVFFSGTLGKVQKELPDLVLGGGAELAFIVPGQNPERFSDNAVIELPGLFRDAREATLVYTRLVATGALAGYRDFVVIGAYGTQPETIHSKKPLAALADMRGQKIRANNPTEAAALATLGALPTVLAFNETSPQISSGALDGATVPPAQLFDVGIGRLVTNHYMLATSTAPLTVMMARSTFERLPEPVRALIAKYSGEWAAARYSERYDVIDRDAFAQLKSDPRRSVVMPSASDQAAADAAFAAIRSGWASAGERNRALLALVEAELEKIRAPRKD
jgi:TRAP-type C4-dicarboxylate transport system substrate-binding protein